MWVTLLNYCSRFLLLLYRLIRFFAQSTPMAAGEGRADHELWGDEVGGNIRIVGILADTRGFLDP